MEIEIRNLKNLKPEKCNFWRLFKNHWFLCGIIIILLGVIVFNQFYVITDANNITIILSFVGILTAFIVIGNYAQVKDIETKFKSETEKLQLEFSDVVKLKNEFETIKTDYDKTKKRIIFATNESIGNVGEIIAELNNEKKFYINVIQNYIETIKRHASIEQSASFVEHYVETLKSFLKSINWDEYDFNNPDSKQNNICVFISDITSMDCISETNKNEILPVLKKIHGLQKISMQ
ncbi:MAG: hypothetical protein LBS25_07575 [Candidatus Symbiothrix sp.]|jgi:hypothetical protein|nr:hypothetical protein [Candidatus Symbiothrix sp.]